MLINNNMQQKNSLIVDYFNYHNDYSRKFGKKTVVLMVVGSFYEAYATDELGYDLGEVSRIINTVRTKRNSKDPSVNTKNPYMLGFPVASILDKLHILTENGFTVVVIEQTTPPPHPKREVTGIYTPGTNILSYTSDTSFVVSLYIKEEKQLKTASIIIVGLSACDITTGKTYICESYSTPEDELISLDETIRFLHTYRPKEIIIYSNTKKYSYEYIKSYIDFSCYNVKVIDSISQHYTKIEYQTELLKKVYPSHGMMHPIEYIGLEKHSYSIVSYIMLLEYICSINSNVLSKINIPEIFNTSPIMYIGNSATLQLNIFNNSSLDIGNKRIRCLLDIVDKTSTPLGRRYMHNKLNAPYYDTTTLQKIYDITDFLAKDKHYQVFEKLLCQLSDIEKIYRKMVLGVIRVDEFNNFAQSMNIIIQIMMELKQSPETLSYFTFSKKTKTMKKIINNIEQLFNVSQLKKYTIDKTVQIYNTGVHTDIDELYESMTTKMSFMEKLCEKLSSILGGNNLLTIKKNERAGYYFCATKKRAQQLQEKLKSISEVSVGKITISTSLFVFSYPTINNAKISVPDIETHSDDIISLQNQLNKLVHTYFLSDICNIVAKYGKSIKKIIKMIAELDYLTSNAKVSVLYSYSKPILDTDNCDYSYVDCKQLRHPIIERIIEHEYITHDLCIGKDDMKGMLLYGLNSSGKSSMMKALGISVIMAQAGMFVPAKKFIYSPYQSIFTRISGNDNLFKEQSSFSVEMIELKAIWKRSNKNTLIIGDEVCRGTEQVSGNAIVASTVIKLSQVNATFIFATHLHEIVKLQKIQDIKNVKSFHLLVYHDSKTDELIFDRQLKEGSGDEIYGVTVAKYIIQDDDFTKMTNEIKDELIGTQQHIVQQNTSKYNGHIYIDSCGVCGKKVKQIEGITTLDTHHINHQKDCVDGVVVGKEHIRKNAISNLVVICKECHNKVHEGKIDIDKYVITSSGKKLLHK